MFVKCINISLLVISTVLLFSCSEEKQTVQKSIPKENLKLLPDQISWDVEVRFVDSSFTKAILTARRARIYQDKMETILDSGVHVDFMSKSSLKRMSLLTADSIRIDDRTKNMLAGGHVRVYSDSSRTSLETSLLEWNNNTQKLYSTEFVKILSPEGRTQGFGFESDQFLTKYTIFRVSGEQK